MNPITITRSHSIAQLITAILGTGQLYTREPMSIYTMPTPTPESLVSIMGGSVRRYCVSDIFINDNGDASTPLEAYVHVGYDGIVKIDTNIPISALGTYKTIYYNHANINLQAFTPVMTAMMVDAPLAGRGMTNPDEYVVDHLPNHLTYNSVTNSYYKYTGADDERECVTFIDIEVNANSSKILRGWTLHELESIVNHMKSRQQVTT